MPSAVSSALMQQSQQAAGHSANAGAKLPSYMQPTKSRKNLLLAKTQQKRNDNDDGVGVSAAESSKLAFNHKALTHYGPVEEALGGVHLRLESLQMRGNRLTSLVPLARYVNIQFLDLSENDISSPNFASLSQLHSLKRLYLNSNGLTTVASFPVMPELETLSLSCNLLQDLRGLPPQPKLKSLYCSHNPLSTLAGLPRIKSLELLRADSCPVCHSEGFRVAVATIFGCDNDAPLVLNGTQLTKQDLKFGSALPWCAAMAVQDGWIPSLDEREAAEECLEYFKVRQQQAVPSSHVLQLDDIMTIGDAKVGSTMGADFVIKVNRGALEAQEQSGTQAVSMVEAAIIEKTYKWTALGADQQLRALPEYTDNVITPDASLAGCLLRLDCRAQLGGLSASINCFALFPPVASGTPTIMAARWEGVAMAGEELSLDIRVRDAERSDTRIRIGWLMSENSEDVMWSAEGWTTYSLWSPVQLTQGDTGRCLVAEVVPMSFNGATGTPVQIQSRAILPQDPSRPEGAPSKLASVVITGRGVPDAVLTAYVTVPPQQALPGHGDVTYQWMRSAPNTHSHLNSDLADLQTPKATRRHIASSPALSSQAASASIADGNASGDVDVSGEDMTEDDTGADISGDDISDAAEGALDALLGSGSDPQSNANNLSPHASGGVNGSHRRQSSSQGSWEDILGANGTSYVVSAEDVGCVIGVRACLLWAPQLSVQSAMEMSVVQPPEVQLLDIVGFPRAGERLTVNARVRVTNSREGKSKIKWVRKNPSNGETMVVAVQQELYVPSVDDVDHILSVEFTPFTADGLQGDTAVASTDVIQPVGKILLSCGLTEDAPVVNHHVEVDCHTKDGAEVAFQWFVVPMGEADDLDSGGLQYAIVQLPTVGVSGGNNPAYCPKLTDRDSFIYLLVTASLDNSVERKILRCSQPVSCPPTACDLQVTAQGMDPPTFSAYKVYDHLALTPEGESFYQWYRLRRNGDAELIAGAVHPCFTPDDADDEGCRFFFRYTPVSEAGEKGGVYESPATQPWLNGVVMVTHIELEGLPPQEGEPVSARPMVAPEFASRSEELTLVWRWAAAGSFIPGESAPVFVPTGNQVDQRLEVSVTPVLGGHSMGQVVTASTPAVEASAPRCNGLTVTGGSSQSQPIMCDAKFVGGKEGQSIWRWTRANPETDAKESLDHSNPIYQPTIDDVDCILWIEYTPVRQDGVQGQAVATQVGPILIDERVNMRIQKSINESNASFHVEQLVHNDPPNWLPKKVFVSPGSIAVMMAEFRETVVPITQFTNVQLDKTPNVLRIINQGSETLVLRSPNSLKRDVLAAVIRHWAASHSRAANMQASSTPPSGSRSPPVGAGSPTTTSISNSIDMDASMESIGSNGSLTKKRSKLKFWKKK